MKKVITAIILFMILVGCSNKNEIKDAKPKEISLVSKSNIETQSIIKNNQLEKTSEPIDFDKAVKQWDKEIKDWYVADSFGAIDVKPLKEDYSELHVIMHDNMQVIEDDGRIFIVDEMTEDLQGLVQEIFKYDGLVKVDFEFQDGSPLINN